MSKSSRAVLEAALALPEAERIEIAVRLRESVGPDLDDLDDEAFRKELLRRREEVMNGTDPGIPWSELKKKK